MTTLLHISDLHIATQAQSINLLEPTLNISERGWQSTQSVAASFNLAFYLSRKFASGSGTIAGVPACDVDAIVLSGDLAATGSEKNVELATTIVNATPDSTRPGTSIAPTKTKASFSWRGKEYLPCLRQSSNLATPILIVPGNHDRYDGRTGKPGGQNLERFTGDDWDFGDGTRVQSPEFMAWNNRNPKVKVLFERASGDKESPVVLIGADLSLNCLSHDLSWNPLTWLRSSPVSYLGQGCAYQSICERLQECSRMVADSSASDTTIVWVIHFDPRETSGSLKLRQHENLSNATRQLADEGVAVRAIMCGHTHRTFIAKNRDDNAPSWFANSTIGLTVCGTTTQYFTKGGNWFHLVKITGHKLVVKAIPFVQSTVPSSSGLPGQWDDSGGKSEDERVFELCN